MVKNGWRSASGGGEAGAKGVGEEMGNALRGKLGRYARYLGTMIKCVFSQFFYCFLIC